MKAISLIAASVLVSGATVAPAQTPVSSHEQHQAAGQHPAKAGEDHCAQMMRKMHEMHQMMSDMMKMHQSMAAHSGNGAAKDKPSEEHKH